MIPAALELVLASDWPSYLFSFINGFKDELSVRIAFNSRTHTTPKLESDQTCTRLPAWGLPLITSTCSYIYLLITWRHCSYRKKEKYHVLYPALGVDITSFVKTCLFEAPFCSTRDKNGIRKLKFPSDVSGSPKKKNLFTSLSKPKTKSCPMSFLPTDWRRTNKGLGDQEPRWQPSRNRQHWRDSLVPTVREESSIYIYIQLLVVVVDVCRFAFEKIAFESWYRVHT